MAKQAAERPQDDDDDSDDDAHRFPAAAAAATAAVAPSSPLTSAPSAMEAVPEASPVSANVTMRPGLVLYDFTAEAEHEMSVRTGDVVMVRFDDGVKRVTDGWVSCQTATGDLGLVPDSYVALKD